MHSLFSTQISISLYSPDILDTGKELHSLFHMYHMRVEIIQVFPTCPYRNVHKITLREFSFIHRETRMKTKNNNEARNSYKM